MGGVIIKTLVLVEDPENLPSVKTDVSTISGDITFISLSPAVSYAFERSDLPYRSINQYWKGYQVSHLQGLANIKKIEKLASILDAELRYLYKNPSLNPVRFSFFHLKILFDTLWTIIWIVNEIINTEKPDSVRFYTSRRVRSGIGKYPFSDDESIYASVLSMAGWKIPVIIIRNTVHPNSAEENPKNIKSRTSVLNWVKTQDSLYNLALIWKREGITAAIYSCFLLMVHPSEKPVLLYNDGYNWDDSLIELYQQGISPVVRLFDDTFDAEIQKYPDYSQEIFTVCRKNPALRKYDKILGIDVSEYFFLRLSQIIAKSIPEAIVAYQTAGAIIQQRKIRCLILSTCEHATGHAIVQAAHDAKIPVVSWQHGGAGYSDFPLVPYIEFFSSDWHFVFGKKVAENYQKMAQSAGIKKIPSFFIAGSSSLDSIAKRRGRFLKRSGKTTIVFVTTAYYKNNFINSLPFDPIDLNEHLWTIQKRVMDLIKKYPEIDFIIKLHPSHADKEPIKTYASDQKIRNLTILSSERSLPELMENAGIVIFDHITTGILQVFRSTIPVIVYTGLYPIDPDLAALLRKRSYAYDTINDFMDSIEQYIRIQDIPDVSVDSGNNDFIKMYGTDMRTLNSAHRAAEKLNEIIS